MNISSEQTNVVRHLQKNYNVAVDSVAGSGKTTCSLFIAKEFSDKNILLLTYNSKLKFETRQRVLNEGVCNMEVHSYHSFCVRYYDNGCFTDTEMRNILTPNKEPLTAFRFDLVIIDEAQDMTPLYYQLVCKILSQNQSLNTQLCLFGDRNQSIFGFNNSDARFIEMPERVFRHANSLEWVSVQLTTTFRLTCPMSDFLNNCLLGYERLRAVKPSNFKPRYIVCDCFDSKNTFNEIEMYLIQGYAPEDIFILAPSVRSGKSSPVRILENAIKKRMPDVMIFIPGSDEEKMNLAVTKGKLVFSTFHQAKGLERKVVVILGFDQSYYKYYNQSADSFQCCNELYVAATRATERMTLFHNSRNPFMNFIDPNQLVDYCEYISFAGNLPIVTQDEKVQKIIQVSVTDLIRHLPDEVLNQCYSKIIIEQDMRYKYNTLDIPQHVETTNNMTETVTELTGVAIPSMFEYTIKNVMSIYDTLIKFMPDAKLRKSLQEIELETITPSQLLYLANCWNTHNSGYLFKLYQITEYTWLTEEVLSNGIQRLGSLGISPQSIFEQSLKSRPSQEIQGRSLLGAIDCVDPDARIVYEFKCTQTTKREHFIQLALYMYLHKHKQSDNEGEKNGYRYVLFNMFTNELFNVCCDDETLKWIVKTLVHEKYKSSLLSSDEKFLERCDRITSMYSACFSSNEILKNPTHEEVKAANEFFLHITMADLGF